MFNLASLGMVPTSSHEALHPYSWDTMICNDDPAYDLPHELVQRSIRAKLHQNPKSPRRRADFQPSHAHQILGSFGGLHADGEPAVDLGLPGNGPVLEGEPSIRVLPVLGRHRHLLGDQAVLDPALLVLQHPQTRASLAALSELANADPIVLVACAWLGEDECPSCLCFDSLLSLLLGLGMRVHANADIAICRLGFLIAKSKSRNRVGFGLPSS